MLNKGVTYTGFLKVETISRGAQVLHRFGYDANGVRVAERRSDGTLVFFVGEYYDDFFVQNLGQGYQPGGHGPQPARSREFGFAELTSTVVRFAPSDPLIKGSLLSAIHHLKR